MKKFNIATIVKGNIRKIVMVATAIITTMVVALFLMVQGMGSPLGKEEALARLESYFDKAGGPTKAYSGVQVHVFSKGKGLDWYHSAGVSGRTGEVLSTDQPFHVASIGKLFTATIILQMAEEGKMNLDDPIADHIQAEILEGLFIFECADHSSKVTFRHLLAHTSGVADYFGDPVIGNGTSKDNDLTMQQSLITEKDRFWLPEELVAFSKDNQLAVGKPGESYHYSDTGYVLLGLLIETIEGKSFEAVIHDRIFNPVGMKHSYMALRSQPESAGMKPLADLWLLGEELGESRSLSADWAGGGVISTLEDLRLFSQALNGGQLISSESQEVLFSNENKFQPGIYTGTGGMSLRFKEFFPLLELPEARGHIGILSTHLFYDKETDTHIVMNFGSDAKMVDSFKALIEVMLTLRRIN